MSNVKEGRRRVCVAVPATSANMGAGFDCIGIAVNIWNEIILEISDKFFFNAEGEGEKDLPQDENNLVIKSIMYAYKIVNKEMPKNIKITCKNRIPFARGLGSSSAAIVGGLLGGLYLAGYDIDIKCNNEKFINDSIIKNIILNCAADIEGHADNVAPALYGGMQISICVNYEEDEIKKTMKEENKEYETDLFKNKKERKWISHSVKLPSNIKCIIYVPNILLTTEEARAILPPLVSRKNAIFNISRAALLVNSLINNNMDILKYAIDDSIHEQYREKQNYHYRKIKEAALKAGAYSVHLSGSGPSIFVIIDNEDIQKKNIENKIINAILKAAEEILIEGKIFVTIPSHIGAHITSLDPPLSNDQINYFTSFKTYNII